MSIIRTAKRENPFVQIDKYFLDDDPNLTYEAKGILAYVLSKPDSWTIRKTDLIKRSKSGKTRVESAMLELMANGYLNWYQSRDENGAFGEWVYEVYERPEFNPNAEEFIKKGKERINNRKKRNKERNVKNDDVEQPKVDNQPSELPKVDNPLSDNPTSEKQPFSNNDFSNNDFSNNNLEEEEEVASLTESELIRFLKTKNISLENAVKFENKLIDEQLVGYTDKQVIEAIEWSLEQFEQGKCFEPYVYAVGRLKRMLDGKLKDIKSTSKEYSSKGKLSSNEIIPEWFNKRNQIKEEKPLSNDEKKSADERRIEILRGLGLTEEEIMADMEKINKVAVIS